MNIKITHDTSILGKSVFVDEVVEVTDSVAKYLINIGFAVEAKEKPKAKPAVKAKK